MKSAIKLQAAIRGHLVRKNAVETLHCIRAIVKVQALVRARSSKFLVMLFLSIPVHVLFSFYEDTVNAIVAFCPLSCSPYYLEPVSIANTLIAENCNESLTAASPHFSVLKKEVILDDLDWLIGIMP